MMAIFPSPPVLRASSRSRCRCSPAGAQGPEGAFERTLKVTGAVDLEVQSGSGSIKVEPGAAGSVRVAARLKAGNSWLAGSDVEKRIRQIEQKPPIEQQGNVIRIGRFADEDLSRNISISYEVTVPAATKLAAHTGSGSIAIGAINCWVKSGSGSVKVEGAASSEATRGAPIGAAGCRAARRRPSGSGSITIAVGRVMSRLGGFGRYR
jgi:hypothetical protein